MAGQRTTFGKLQRERAKQAKQEAKRDRRKERAAGGGLATTSVDGLLTPAELLRRVEELQREFDAGTISIEDLHEQRAALAAQLPAD